MMLLLNTSFALIQMLLVLTIKGAPIELTGNEAVVEQPGKLSTNQAGLYRLNDPLNTPSNEPTIYQDANTRLLEKLVVPWVMYYTNQYRKENGLDTLLYDACLMEAAGFHTNYLYNEARVSQQFKLVHQQDPASKWFKGKGPSDRALAAGCKKYCGENALYTTLPNILPGEFSQITKLNLAAKKIARDMVFTQWHQSKGHRENMLTKGYTNFGVSVAIAKQTSGSSGNFSERMIALGIQLMAY